MDVNQPETAFSLTPPRPAFNRQRSNSLPLTEPLQCTATEAAIMFAAERAVLNRRRAPSVDATERRRPLSARDPKRTHRDNIRRRSLRTPSKYNQEDTSSSEDSEDNENIPDHWQRQAPPPKTTSTTPHTIVTAPPTSSLARSNTSPTAVYSAGLAKFIQGRLVSLNSGPGSQPIPAPRSCPNLSQVPRKSRSQPNERRQIEREEFERPQLRSSFSAWSTPGDSSTFEEDTDDEIPLPSEADKTKQSLMTSTSTPSILEFYQTSAQESSFLLPETPADHDEEDDKADTHSISSEAPSTIKPGCISRSISSSTTVTHVEEPKHTPDQTRNVPEKRSPVVREPSYFQKATSPFKTLMAISPYEGQALTRVYDMQVHGTKRIVTEGMAFDLFRDLKMPMRHSRVM